MTDADPLLEWCEGLLELAKRATAGPWIVHRCTNADCGIVDGHDGPVAFTEVANPPPARVDYRRAGRNARYIAALEPRIGAALADLARAVAEPTVQMVGEIEHRYCRLCSTSFAWIDGLEDGNGEEPEEVAGEEKVEGRWQESHAPECALAGLRELVGE